MDRLVRLNEVCDIVGLRKSAVYDRISKGQFPTPVAIGPRAVAWKQSDLARWIETLRTRH